jgi:glycosyltransferase involved in cell wall biosynthesis
MGNSSAKKVIGYYDDSVNPGGTTRYLSTLISGLNRSEFDVIVFAPEPRPWHRDFEAIGCELVTLKSAAAEHSPAPSHGGTQASSSKPRLRAFAGWFLGLAKETMRLRRLFQTRRVDLLHSNNAGAEPAPIAARLAGVPVVIATWHVDSTYDLDNVRSGPRYRLLERACMRSLHHAISVSHAVSDDWMRRCGLPASWRKRITVIHNGIDIDGLCRRRSLCDAKAEAGLGEKLVIGSIGRLDAAKGYEYLIKALPKIIDRHPEALLRIAGRGDLLEPLEQLARELGVDSSLEFTGFTADVQSFLECIDIYVQPSLCEALGLSILEACAVGVPVIGSNVGGLPESIRQGRTGFLVPPRQPDALAEAVLRMADKPSLRARMAEEARRVVSENFRREQMVEETVSVYRRLLAGNGH